MSLDRPGTQFAWVDLKTTLGIAGGLLGANLIETGILYYFWHNQLAVILAVIPLVIMLFTTLKQWLQRPLTGKPVGLGGFDLDDFSLFDAVFVLITLVWFNIDLTPIGCFWLLLTATIILAGRVGEYQASLKQTLQVFWWVLVVNMPLMLVYGHVGQFHGL